MSTQTNTIQNPVSNLYNIKAGDSFKEKDFLGNIFIINISLDSIQLKKEHVSCQDEYTTISMKDFNNKKLFGTYHTLVKC